MASSIGKNIRTTLFGESHGEAIGCVIDGFPAGIKIDLNEVRAFMARRAPGNTTGSTSRREPDIPEVISGLLNDTTTGAPITCIIRNSDTRSKDYADLSVVPRPGHADYTLSVKTGGNNDIRGGGHSSGRIMAGLCFAGSLAIQYLRLKNISVNAQIDTIGKVKISGERDSLGLNNAAKEEIEKARTDLDSIGGTITCKISGLPAGLGEPIFGGVENRLSYALFGIPAVKGVEFGSGFKASEMRGSENNDDFYCDGDSIKTKTNNHGGILGGITSGMDVTMRVAIKPTPSIGKEQVSVDLTSKETVSPFVVKGRHDSCIVPRAVPIVEAVAAIVALDLLLDP